MEHVDQVKEITEDLLKRLEVVGMVAVDVDETGAYQVHIETEETGLLIGYHGRTLESFQILLGIIVSKKLAAWVKVYVNVGDYRQKREETLMHMAQRAAERALSFGHPVELPNLSPSERRVIHLTLGGDERVETESVGEGMNRTLVVKPKA
ncbi:KH domain-containing protein [Candidatus Gottesmanbacteria bacterium]|nr:KH domain-containing protein [Candidatus Gottesmanbacteria bacterium]